MIRDGVIIYSVCRGLVGLFGGWPRWDGEIIVTFSDFWWSIRTFVQKKEQKCETQNVPGEANLKEQTGDIRSWQESKKKMEETFYVRHSYSSLTYILSGFFWQKLEGFQGKTTFVQRGNFTRNIKNRQARKMNAANSLSWNGICTISRSSPSCLDDSSIACKMLKKVGYLLTKGQLYKF